jgi:phosphoribosylaminoimidazole-succinocarboxamide synthase
MAGVESRDFASPDETRTPDKTRLWTATTTAHRAKQHR